MDNDSVIDLIRDGGFLASYNPTKELSPDELKIYAKSLRQDAKNADSLLVYLSKKYKPNDVIVVATVQYIQKIKNTQYALSRRYL